MWRSQPRSEWDKGEHILSGDTRQKEGRLRVIVAAYALVRCLRYEGEECCYKFIVSRTHISLFFLYHVLWFQMD